jgi:hypothetical protein
MTTMTTRPSPTESASAAATLESLSKKLQRDGDAPGFSI